MEKPHEKAKEIYDKILSFSIGRESAKKTTLILVDELTKENSKEVFNQKRVDFWLDVRNVVSKISVFLLLFSSALTAQPKFTPSGDLIVPRAKIIPIWKGLVYGDQCETLLTQANKTIDTLGLLVDQANFRLQYIATINKDANAATNAIWKERVKEAEKLGKAQANNSVFRNPYLGGLVGFCLGIYISKN